MKGFSIIVCCYNSEKVIAETLQRLGALKVPSGYQAEVVVVNNACTDATVQLARDTWNKLNAPFDMAVVDEDRPGLSFARNKGIGSAHYDYLLFCDDDNRLAPDYLSVAASVFREYPNIGILGGLGIPDYETLPAYWPNDFYIYGSGPQAAGSGEVSYVHGAGIIISRAAFQKLERAGFTFLLTDRKGDQLSSGGDYELCYAVGLAGYIVWYEQRLTFRHFITTDRLAQSYCWKFIRESAPAIDILDLYRYFLHRSRSFHSGFYFHQFKLLFYHAYEALRSSVVRIKYRHDQRIVFLENFHIRFHQMRIKCIARSFTKYKSWARQVAALKHRLNT